MTHKYDRAVRGPLVPCPHCSRHLFAAVEGACPFCGGALPESLVAAAAPAAGARLSRSEMFRFNADRRVLNVAELQAATGGVTLFDVNGQANGIPSASVVPPQWDPNHFGDGGSQMQMYGMAPQFPDQQLRPYDPGQLGPPDDGSQMQMYGMPSELPNDPLGTQPGQDDWPMGPPLDDNGTLHAEYGAPSLDPDQFPPDFDPNAGVEAVGDVVDPGD